MPTASESWAVRRARAAGTGCPPGSQPSPVKACSTAPPPIQGLGADMPNREPSPGCTHGSWRMSSPRAPRLGSPRLAGLSILRELVHPAVRLSDARDRLAAARTASQLMERLRDDAYGDGTGSVLQPRDDDEEEIVALRCSLELRGRQQHRVRLGVLICLEFVESRQCVHRVGAEAALGPQVAQPVVVGGECLAYHVQRHLFL